MAATSVNDMFKAALGAYLLRRVVGRPLSLSTLREFAIYLAIVVVLTPMLSAFGGGGKPTGAQLRVLAGKTG